MTISIDMEAYERLCAARLTPGDSFSRVIKRAHWERKAMTCAGVLSALPSIPMAEEEILDRLEAAQQKDEPPDNPWS